MRELVFDVGITATLVARHLRSSPILSIVGFHNSGKSTLAEVLEEDLETSGYSVLMQNASYWLPNQHGFSGRRTRFSASIDPEIVAAMDQFEQADGESCWIIDDSEVMLAYASEELLRNLGAQIRRRGFSMVLIRNRFVLEDEGWFHQRQSLIASKIEKMIMRPLDKGRAREAATAMFRGKSRRRKGNWLAAMAGGIPGLMSDLHRYTPEWPTNETTPQLMRFVSQKRGALGLAKPIRQVLITALGQRLLPPSALLSEQARTELGSLILTGMVSPDYFTGNTPFNGGFWKLVSGQEIESVRFPRLLEDIGLNLETMIRKANLIEIFGEECGIPPENESDFARSFAASLFCQHQFPEIVQPLETFFCDSLGRSGLSRILLSQGIEPKRGTSTDNLCAEVFEQARPR